ncbi:TonB-dependent receptor plug domain-containing protein [Sphingomonas sp. VDB2]|uniref:TonB-dependent receptor plug domain-containing protein n=1 Tax=Sphingomonas sp. VDB2 TaxID=3228751 RepID=UPI003A804DAE
MTRPFRHALTIALLGSAGWQGGALAADAPAADAAGSLDIVVLGSRSADRTVAQSTAPIDVVGNDALVATGGAAGQLRDALSALVPSFKVDTGSNAAYNTFGRPAGLRGLSGAHVLVLVNGKRRHPSSVPLPTTAQASGANAVDLDQIPMSAIDHVEILRDGAAAQYGSDAVAGVINIVLKKDASGGSVTIYGGERYRGDGEQAQVRLNYGFKLPNEGFLNLSADYFFQDFAFRPGLATVQNYPKINGQPDPREATRDRHLTRGGGCASAPRSTGWKAMTTNGPIYWPRPPASTATIIWNGAA